MKIGLYGGTFNPPHLGHKRLADEMFKSIGLDKMMIIPANVPPHKIAKDILPGDVRMKMCEMTFFEPHYTVCDIELKKEGFSYTFYTIEDILEEYPGAELFLIIGSDMGLSFHKWHRYKEILERCTLCLMSRSEEVSPDDLFNYAKNTLGLEKSEVIVSTLEPFETSSTKIKRMLRNGEDVSALLDKNVAEYIKANNFYL